MCALYSERRGFNELSPQIKNDLIRMIENGKKKHEILYDIPLDEKQFDIVAKKVRDNARKNLVDDVDKVLNVRKGKRFSKNRGGFIG